MKKAFCIYLCLSLALFITFPAYSQTKDADNKSLFEKKCSTCHSIDRPKSKKKTEDEWKKTVMRMKNVNGAAITDEEAKKIIDYLSKTLPK